MNDIYTFRPTKPPHGTMTDLTHSPVVTFDVLDADCVEAVREDDVAFICRRLGYEWRVCGLKYTLRGVLDSLDVIVRGRPVRVYVGGCGVSYRLSFATIVPTEYVAPSPLNM